MDLRPQERYMAVNKSEEFCGPSGKTEGDVWLALMMGYSRTVGSSIDPDGLRKMGYEVVRCIITPLSE